ncbi:hypothetical protein C0971_08740 [Bacillus methanolicus]|nr:hypothetical protein C0971_08740 [Bacillus methanolicus]
MSDLLNITVGKLLEEKAKLHPNHEAVVYADRFLRMTYDEFDRHCRKAARGLMRLGLEKGEHIAIWSTNTPEWLTCQFATGKIGAVLVTVNTNYRTSELEYLLKQSDSTTIVLMERYRDSSYIDMLYEIVPELKNSKPGVFFASKKCRELQRKIHRLAAFFFTLIFFKFHRRKSIFQPVTFSCECNDMRMVYQAIH